LSVVVVVEENEIDILMQQASHYGVGAAVMYSPRRQLSQRSSTATACA
jgi:hypothetical protein